MSVLIRAILAIVVLLGVVGDIVWMWPEADSGSGSRMTTAGQTEDVATAADGLAGDVEDAPLADSGGDQSSDAAGGVLGDAVSDGPSTSHDTPTPTRQTTVEAPATETALPTASAEDSGGRRYDEVVLRWLPELRAASDRYGVSVALLAGVVRVMSNGDPGVIRYDDRRGLSGVTEGALAATNLERDEWHDPGANVRVAAAQLSRLRDLGRPWRQVLAEYVGGECDALTQCPDDYAFAILAWRDSYSSILRNPEAAGVNLLAESWQTPRTIISRQTAPVRLTLPEGVDWPAVTATATVAAPATPTATDVPPAASDEATPEAELPSTPTPMAPENGTPEALA